MNFAHSLWGDLENKARGAGFFDKADFPIIGGRMVPSQTLINQSQCDMNKLRDDSEFSIIFLLAKSILPRKRVKDQCDSFDKFTTDFARINMSSAMSTGGWYTSVNISMAGDSGNNANTLHLNGDIRQRALFNLPGRREYNDSIITRIPVSEVAIMTADPYIWDGLGDYYSKPGEKQAYTAGNCWFGYNEPVVEGRPPVELGNGSVHDFLLNGGTAVFIANQKGSNLIEA